VPAQITELLALTGGLFDAVPLDQMTAAENAVQKGVEEIPPEVRGRFETAAKLSDEDRKMVVELARKWLAAFQPPPKAEKKT
jgi:F-type H+-transporting ATPase subunit alpha